ncbi:MAG: hypothetical protein GF364_19670, partial [Candidatus Lokiarchaeota archaeon]|nr:hypothetical protein [Candidatus Lokiarchaeota archaeon]
MNRDLKNKLKPLFVIAIILGTPLLLLLGLNIPKRELIQPGQVSVLKEHGAMFSASHQHPESGLFIETDFESNFRAVDSLNWSDGSLLTGTKLVDPRNNPTMIFQGNPDFFFTYLYEKQNTDGGFSDIGGFSNMHSTYQMMKIMDDLNSTWLDQANPWFYDKNNKTIDYVNSCLAADGWGFKFNPLATPDMDMDMSQMFPEIEFISENMSDSVPDIISTYMGISIAKRFNANSLLTTNQLNISRFINSTLQSILAFSGYALTNESLFEVDPQSTYYGIQAFKEMGMTYNILDKQNIINYLNSLYNTTDGGYEAFYNNGSDIVSTYYALASLYELNAVPTNEQKSYWFILNCSKLDGGFGFKPSPEFISDFQSGWAALKGIELLEPHISTPHPQINVFKKNYKDWLYKRQAQNALFGSTTVEANYWGVTAIYYAKPGKISKETDSLVKVDNITNFLTDCYQPGNGGFGSRPETNTSLFATYCAMNIYEIFWRFNENFGPDQAATINYISSMQNDDGGFKIGDDLEYLLSFYGGYGGGYSGMFEGLIDTNQSTTESTYWAVKSLDILNVLHLKAPPIHRDNLTHWIKSAQNADGGY